MLHWLCCTFCCALVAYFGEGGGVEKGCFISELKSLERSLTEEQKAQLLESARRFLKRDSVHPPKSSSCQPLKVGPVST